MQLTLRKARKLETRIDNFDLPKTETPIRVNLTDADVVGELEEKRKEFRSFYDQAKKLLTAKYEIRELIGKANSEHGINDLITKRQAIKHRLNFVSGFVSRIDIMSNDVVIDTIKNERESEGSRFGGPKRSQVEVSFFTEDLLQELKDEKANLKSRLDEVEEEILVLNNSKHIELSDDTVELLREAQLI